MLARCTKVEPPCPTDDHREIIGAGGSKQVEWAEETERLRDTVGGRSEADVNVRN